MDMTIAHTNGMQFVASVRGHDLTIDLPAAYKGQDTGPTPPEVFIASLGSCIGVYILNYLKAQELPCDGVTVKMRWEDESSPARIGRISAEVVLPEEISPEHRRMALRAAQQCKIRNTIKHQPDVSVSLSSNGARAAE